MGTCGCNAGWSGLACDIDVDECVSGMDNCDINAVCTNTPGGFNCTCNIGFFGDGFTCTPLPRGACCDESTGMCGESFTQTDCAQVGHRYGGNGSNCSSINPPCVVVDPMVVPSTSNWKMVVLGVLFLCGVTIFTAKSSRGEVTGARL